MLKKIVLTGATGFIGSNLLEVLVKQQFEVHIIVRSGSNLDKLKNFVNPNNIFVFNGETVDVVDYFKSLKKIDTVIHLASLAISTHGVSDIDCLVESNLRFGCQLLEAMKESGCKKLINTSTFWQHYNNEKYNPVCLYAATKEAFERIVDYYVEAYNFKCITLELFDTYGKQDTRKKILDLLIECAVTEERLDLTPSEQYVDFIHIDDVVAAYLVALINLESSVEKTNKKYMVTSGVPIQLKNVVQILEDISGKRLNIQLGGRVYREREIMIPWNKGEMLPNWNTMIGLRDGISKTYFQKELKGVFHEKNLGFNSDL